MLKTKTTPAMDIILMAGVVILNLVGTFTFQFI